MWKIMTLCLAVLLTACSQDAPSEDAADDPTPTQQVSNIQACEGRTPSPPPQADADTVGKQKPQVQAPDGPPPCKLVSQDIAAGEGTTATEGSTVTVHYVGVSWSTGEQFEASWGGQPPTFPLNNVIAGWQQGIPGMREGGRRQLIIPPDLAYGAQGRPGIAPNETLVFVIDLLKVA